MKKTTVLTHLSYDKKGNPFIGRAIPLSGKTLPKGRLTGIFGRQAGLRATTYWWKKIESLYNKDLSKVELYLHDKGKASINQSIELLDKYEILNILLAQSSLTDQLNEWGGDSSYVETRFLGDREFYRRIIANPEIINRLFERPELAKIKAIIWPAVDPDNKLGYIKMVTLRSADVIDEKRVFNFDGDVEAIPYKFDDSAE